MKRTKCNCKFCSLSEKNRVWSEEGSGSKLMLVGEAPGQDEDAQRKPFVGASGRLLGWALKETGLFRPNLWITNVVSCRPPSNDIESLEGQEGLLCCRPGFYEELDVAAKSGVTTVLALGKTASVALGVQGPLEKVRGSVYEFKTLSGSKLFVIPTYHPAAIMRQHWKRTGGGTADAGVLWLADFRKARELSENGWKPIRELFNIKPTLSDALAFIDDALKSNALVAIDTETTGLNPDYARIVVIGLAVGPERALSIPLLDLHGSAYWSPADWAILKPALQNLFATCDQMYQNCFFDVPMLRRHGFMVPSERILHDTLMLHHCLTGDTVIDTLDFGKKPIKELVGKKFWVFSHDGEKIVPKPIKSCWSTGVRDDLYRVVFWSKDRKGDKKMWIDCTSDHEFPLQGVDHKVKAIDLKPGDRLYPGQYSSNHVGRKEIHRWVYEQVNGEKLPSYYEVHHIDRNHYNNNPDNLIAITTEAHAKLHNESREKAVLALVKARENYDETDTNYSKVIYLYSKVGLSVREVAKELNVNVSRVNTILKREHLTRNRSEANILRWQKAHNCRIIAVVPLKGAQEVYDIEVPETHCFSANGIIVGNSIAPESKHDLGTIVSLYGQTPYWKGEFLNRTTTILEMDQAAMRTYNLRDCVVLHQVLPVMLRDLQELNLAEFYRDEVQPLMACVLEMTEEGLGFNESAQRRFKDQLERMVAEKLQVLRESLRLPGSFNPDSDDHLRWFLYGWVPNTFRLLDDLDKKRPGTKIYEQLVGLKAVKDRGQAYVLKGWTPPKTDSGKPAVDKAGILAFQIQLNNRRSAIVEKEAFSEEVAAIDKLLTWLKDLAEYVRLQKYLSTYTNYQPGKDGRVHSRWIMHGTVSGRLASREVNFQNIPKARDDPNDPAAQVRHFFVSRPGWSFVSCDYVNLEAQLLAYETLDPQLVSVFEKGLNLHDLNTQSMFKIDETSPRWKSARRAAKIFFFGGISYGGGDRTIFEKVWLEAPELNLTFADFKQAKDSWMADHPAYVAWKAKIAAEVMTKREVRTEFGRYRQFLSNDVDIVKEALDFKIQSSGASLVNRSMVRIAQNRDALRLKARFVLQVHDQLVMECPDEEVETVKNLMVSEMEKPFVYKGVTRKIPVDPTVGKTFGEL